MLGISLGHALMVFLLGVGLAQVFVLWPRTHDVLKVASVLYMTWLAWRKARPTAGEARRSAADLAKETGMVIVAPMYEEDEKASGI